MKIIDAIFCEDIRFELNNKLSLMGLYSDQIIFQTNGSAAAEIQWPIATTLALLLRFKIEKNEKHPDQFKFEYLIENSPLINISGQINMDKKQSTISIALLTPQLPLRPGNLGFSIQLLEGSESVFSYENNAAIEIATN
ncbi:hypothetical protein ELY21_00430 [Legionella sp. km535]|uniref:hypothetical protein n=1 Tax=Legionella sp. km535 TaxID=2498107 RepID=UPI000F8C7319|nr:hypothetical protein [Legionella sp. km535]RUR20587.1 hypothetical protein ELY21_00430 [Legionella sp. km535]